MLVIQVGAKPGGTVMALDKDTGKEIWNHKGSMVPIASPALADGKLFACGSPFQSGVQIAHLATHTVFGMEIHLSRDCLT